MTLIDNEHMRDRMGRSILVGHTVKALRLSSKTGAVFDFHGYVAQVRPTAKPGRLEALCQPFPGGEAKWLGAALVELPEPDTALLDGVLAEWHEGA